MSIWMDTNMRQHHFRMEVVLPHVIVSVSVGHLPYDDIVDPNATTLPMHSTPGIDSPVIGVQTAGT